MRRKLPLGVCKRFARKIAMMLRDASAGHTLLRLGRTGAAVCVLSAVLLTACGDEGNNAKVIFTTGFGKEDVFRVGNGVCTVPEIMVYLTNTGNQYESVYGPDVWNVSRNGITLEENVKETVLAKMAQIKTMYLLAQDRGVTLEEEENQRVERAAAEYFLSLNEDRKSVV